MCADDADGPARMPSEFIRRGHPWPYLIAAWQAVEDVLREPAPARPARLALLADGVLIVNPADRITHVYRRPTLIGASSRDLRGQLLVDSFPRELVAGWHQTMEDAVALGASLPMNYALWIDRYAAYVVRTALVVPSPEPRAHVALLIWHRGLRGIGNGEWAEPTV
jgi:hypothetical protein